MSVRTKHIVAYLTGLVAGTLLGWAVWADADQTTIGLYDGKPMPCVATEVMVWSDYPVRAVCVDASDHASHEGHP